MKYFKECDENEAEFVAHHHPDLSSGALVIGPIHKPKTPIDMSCLRGSDVIMKDTRAFGAEHTLVQKDLTDLYLHKMRFTDKWVPNVDKKNPWPVGVKVTVLSDTRRQYLATASNFVWGESTIASRFAGFVDGYCYPGEVE